MKKLYRKGTVHPTSPPIISDHLSFLPAAILTLAAALSPEDKEVLAYLISACSSSNNFKNNNSSISGATVKGCSDHPPVFKCDCFGCYTSYWVRWDLSPNRELIHEIIDAYEEGLAQISRSKSSNKNNRKERRRKKINNGSGSGSKGSEVIMKEMEKDGEREEKEEMEKGSVRRIVGFIGERIWSAWT